MRAFALETLTNAAIKAGLEQTKIMDVSAADNITIPRPRLEYQFLPETYIRTGRKLDIGRESGKQVLKKELYEVSLEVTANVLAEDPLWLANFEFDFVASLPRGGDDQRGNWVKIRVQKATFKNPPTKRVGETDIKIFNKLNTLFSLTFTGRVTEVVKKDLLKDVTFNDPEYR